MTIKGLWGFHRAAVVVVLATVFFCPTVGAVPLDQTQIQRQLLIGADRLASKPAERRTPAEREAVRGFEMLLTGDTSGAEAAFESALVADPKLTAALIGLADVRVNQQRPDEARAYLERALATGTDNADTYTALGRFYYGQGRTAEAKAAYLKAISLDPNALIAHVDLADLYSTAERNPAASAAEYRKALAINPAFTPARIGLGMALLAGGYPEGALVEFARAAQDSPQDPTAWHLIGRVHASEGRFAEAADAFSKALQAQPDFLPALMDRADVYAEMGEDQKAEADYQRVAQSRPKDAIVRLKLGMIHQRLGETAKAQADYREALRLNPDLAPAANNLAMMTLRSGGNLDEALALARKAVALSPTVPQFHDTLGRVYRARGDRAAATASLEKATTLPPPQADIWFQLGQLYDEGGRKPQAVGAYRRALQLDPKFPEADTARARIESLGQ